ncbi:MAG: hypothetical protein IT496_01320 [Gammaproteobacteria bacterium]|nr:hypothetical protein [Gammaproteobacteria bacterium]MCG3145465.1 hypothetical protein [Gammaproteobacteria bacterium]
MKRQLNAGGAAGARRMCWLRSIALLAAYAGMPTEAPAECPAPPGRLATQQRDERQALRLEQQGDLDRARGLPSSGQVRAYELTIEQRGEQQYLHDQQQLEQTIRNSRSSSRPAPPGGAEQLLQRYRLEDAERQHDFRMQRDQR